MTPLREQLQTVANGWADESSCIECHEQADSFWKTGHARSLLAAGEDESLALLRDLQTYLEAEQTGVRIEFEADIPTAVVTSRNGAERRLTLDWCVGSGEHARTWVGTLTDSVGETDLCEFRYTWYREIDGFAITPGQPEETNPESLTALGVMFDHAKARRCFACHVSSLPIEEGTIQEDRIHTGISCQRCHGPRAAHVASEGEIVDGFWRDADRMEAVMRCAECHRREEEQKPEDIHPTNPELARFQPIGLLKSPCFTKTQMTCTTCHDPHKPLDEQDSLNIRQCVQCHDGSDEEHPPCGAGQITDCFRCHMPKVKLESPISFTDHWIRIRDDIEWQP